MQTTRVNAVFEGGGVKGISLVGAVRAAEQCGVAFNRLAGTSSGSIVASLLAAGCDSDEIRRIIEATPFSHFLKRAPIFNAKVIGPAMRLFIRKGLYSGDALEDWIKEVLASKGVKSFGDLPPGKLRIVASDITNGKLLVLPHDIAAYGIEPDRFSVAKAIRMSTSIPYFFDPVVLRQPIRERKKVNAKFSYIVDGGLLSNFPMWLFENEEATDRIPTLGFQIVGRNDSHPHRIVGPFTMFQAMFETMLSAHDERYIEQNNRARTIKIPALGIRTTQFHITPELSRDLYLSGLNAGEKFFRTWSRRPATLNVGIKPQ